MDDADLVKQFLNGHKEAFAELVKKYSKPLTRMIYRIIRDSEEAKDISQIVFLKAYRALPKFVMASSFKTWLYSIAINTTKDHLRKQKLNTFPDDALEAHIDLEASTGECLEKMRKIMTVRDAIEKLPPKQRLTLQLRIYEEMDYEQIAAILGGTPGGARVNFFQATKALKERLRSVDDEN